MASFTILEVIAESIVDSIKIELIKIGLKDSRIIKKVSYEINEKTGLLTFQIPEYAKYIEAGRRAGSGRGFYVPINILIRWVKKKRLATGKDAISMAYAIRTNIFKRGILNAVRPRPFINKAIENAGVDFQFSISLQNLLDEKINKIFNL